MRSLARLATALWVLLLPATVAAQTVGDVPEAEGWMALARIALGFVLLAAGVGSLALSVANRRLSGLPLFAFGVLALLYGAGFLVASPVLAPLFGVPRRSLAFAAGFIYYVLPIPGLVYAEQIRGPGWHGLLRRLWQVTIPFAVGFIVYDLAVDTPLASFRIYGFYIIGVMSVLLPHVVAWRQKDRVESTARTVGTGALVLSILNDNLVAFGFFPWRVSLQIFGVAAFLLSLGFVTLRRLLTDQRELAAVERELTMAQNIQGAILPHTVPKTEGLEISVRYVPSRFVAGDVYGFLTIDAHRLGILVADVTGHGVPAALIASMTTAVFSSQVEHAADTGRVLSAMNRALAGRFEGQFVTAAYAFVDTERRLLKYSVAGHPPPLLHRRDSGTIVRLTEAGLVLGFLPEVQYPTGELAFAPGDRLILYTDGISEARSPVGDWFGDQELVSFANRRADLNADGFARELVAHLERWTGHDASPRPFDDDLTLIVIDAQ
jgi:sigma-B regulation protein RsbU (phosphoserine phosphatase)